MSIPKDKIQHFIGGAIIALVVGLIMGPLIGLAAAAVIGVEKEIYDKVSGKGCPELMDAFATFLGALVVYGVMIWIMQFTLR